MTADQNLVVNRHKQQQTALAAQPTTPHHNSQHHCHLHHPPPATPGWVWGVELIYLVSVPVCQLLCHYVGQCVGHCRSVLISVPVCWSMWHCFGQPQVYQMRPHYILRRWPIVNSTLESLATISNPSELNEVNTVINPLLLPCTQMNSPVINPSHPGELATIIINTRHTKWTHHIECTS